MCRFARFARRALCIIKNTAFSCGRTAASRNVFQFFNYVHLESFPSVDTPQNACAPPLFRISSIRVSKTRPSDGLTLLSRRGTLIMGRTTLSEEKNKKNKKKTITPNKQVRVRRAEISDYHKCVRVLQVSVIYLTRAKNVG